MYFDFDATQTDSFEKNINFQGRIFQLMKYILVWRKTLTLAYYMEGDRLASEFAGELKAGRDISQKIFKEG